MKNMNKMNTEIVITIELAYKNNGETKERGTKFISNHTLDKIENPSEVLLASL